MSETTEGLLDALINSYREEIAELRRDAAYWRNEAEIARAERDQLIREKETTQ